MENFRYDPETSRAELAVMQTADEAIRRGQRAQMTRLALRTAVLPVEQPSSTHELSQRTLNSLGNVAVSFSEGVQSTAQEIFGAQPSPALYPAYAYELAA